MNEQEFIRSNSLQNASPQKQFLFLFILVFTGLSLASIVSLVFGSLVWGYSTEDLNTLANDPSLPGAIGFLRVSQILSSFGVFIIPSLFIRNYFKTSFYVSAKPSNMLLINGSLFCMAVMIFQVPLVNTLAQWNAALNFPEALSNVQAWMEQREIQAERITDLFLNMNSVPDYILTLFIMAVLPAIGEELLFRGSIQPLLGKIIKNEHAAVWVTAFLFSFIHFQFFGFIPRLLLGAFLGYLFFWSKSLVFPIAAHFANNAFAVSLSFAQQQGLLPLNFEEPGASNSDWYLALFSVVVLIPACIYFKRTYAPKVDLAN
ncbi:MAG: CPBP family intramembrane glutamic endopeptidase [Bacteroidia bacterium]